MIIKSILAAAAIAAMTFTGAAAATYDISLTGQVANISESQIYWSGLHYDEFYLPLSGLDATNAFSVSVGDTVNATVTLDQAITLPVPQDWTGFLLYLTGSSFPAGDTNVHGTFDLYDNGNLVLDLPYWSSTSGQLSAFGVFSGASYTFDSFTVDVQIDNLGVPATLDGAALNYVLVSTVPEPAVWLMLMLGFGMVGLMLRAGRRSAILAH